MVDKSRDLEGLILAPHFSPAPQACSQPSLSPAERVVPSPPCSGHRPCLHQLITTPHLKRSLSVISSKHLHFTVSLFEILLFFGKTSHGLIFATAWPGAGVTGEEDAAYLALAPPPGTSSPQFLPVHPVTVSLRPQGPAYIPACPLPVPSPAGTGSRRCPSSRPPEPGRLGGAWGQLSGHCGFSGG